jgi:branched-subunit amino acid ABC-type transport system permease component
VDLTLVGQSLLSGLLFGGVYSLMAVGLTLIFGVMRVVNFAHGDMMVWGMYLAWLLATRLGVDPYLGFPLCAAALFAIGWAVQRGLVHRIVDAPHEMQILLMLGWRRAGERRPRGLRPRSQRVRSPLTGHLGWARFVTWAGS